MHSNALIMCTSCLTPSARLRAAIAVALGFCIKYKSKFGTHGWMLGLCLVQLGAIWRVWGQLGTFKVGFRARDNLRSKAHVGKGNLHGPHSLT